MIVKVFLVRQSVGGHTTISKPAVIGYGKIIVHIYLCLWCGCGRQKFIVPVISVSANKLPSYYCRALIRWCCLLEVFILETTVMLSQFECGSTFITMTLNNKIITRVGILKP